MSLAAGQLTKRVTFERAVASRDDYNEEVSDWQVLRTTWCQLIYGRGDERRQAAQERGDQAATIVVRASSENRAVTIRDRARVDGLTWDVVGIAEPFPDRVEFSVVAAR